jgi:hypothetical protein
MYVDSKWSEFKPALGGSSLAQGGTPARPSLAQPRLDAEMDPLEAVRRGLANSGRYAS